MLFYVLDRNEELQTIISNEQSASTIYKAEIKEQLNKMYTLDLEVPASSPESQYLIEENYVMFKDLLGEWQLYIIKQVNEVHDFDHVKIIYCEHASQELYDDLCNTEIKGSTNTPSSLLSNLLNGTRWEVGTVDSVTLHACTGETKNKSVLEAVQLLRADYSFDLKFRFNVVGNKILHRYVDLLEHIGNDYGKRFEYSKDTTKIEREVDTTDLKTAVVPEGAVLDGATAPIDITGVTWVTPTNPINKPAGQKYLEDTEATARWGYGTATKRPRFIYYKNDDCKDAITLIEEAYAILKQVSQPKVSYKIDAVDLYALTGDSSLSFESVRLGDFVVVVDKEFIPALAIRTMIIERTVDLLQQENTSIVLGNYVQTLADTSAQSILDQVNKKFDNLDITEFGNGMYEEIQKANDQAFKEAVGYTYLKDTEGLWVYDSPSDMNPTKMVALKGGKLGIGKWNSQTQTWDITTFIDGDSVNASCINAGELRGELLKAGTIDINKFETSVKTNINSIPSKADVTYVNTQISNVNDEISLRATKTEVQEVAEQVTYKVDIISTNGGVFKNGQINTTLIARVYHGATDVTDTIDANRFRWTRVSNDSAGDQAWNTANFGGTKQINVTSTDVYVRATFTCEIIEQ